MSRIITQKRDGDNAQPLSVSEISSALKRTVEDRFGHVRVHGELSGFKRAASGHLYFSLKDDKAKLDGVMWKGVASRLAFAPEDGLEVIVTGKLTTYAGRSSYQVVAESLELAGEGALMALFEKLKARLTEEGLFAAERKRAIPYMPRCIGIVTSPTGAVIRDILHRLNDRFPSHVIIWPVLVQGEGAKGQIANAIRGFSDLPEGGGKIAKPDLVIVARGGGSIEDLWAFNEEIIVRAVAESSIPIISAVGHETDTTLCDYAADLRAPTPTAAAEMAVPVRAELADRIGQNALRLERGVRRSVSHLEERLEGQRRLLPKLSELTAPQQQRADELGERLQRGLQRALDAARISFAAPAGALRPVLLSRLVENAQNRLNALGRLADQLHPEAPLKRGFARVTDDAGETVANVTAARAAGAVNLGFADGEVGAVVGGSKARSAAKKKPANKGQQDLFGE
ncbi:MAG: exodeoxyribonuclease VII large subunit [Sphingorhabdus sp.]